MPRPCSRKRYKYLKPRKGSICLLTNLRLDYYGHIHCSLIPARLSSSPEYDAISYAWNDEQPSIPIICNQKRIFITPSLHGILSILALEAHKCPVWADAVSEVHNSFWYSSIHLSVLYSRSICAWNVVVLLKSRSQTYGLPIFLCPRTISPLQGMYHFIWKASLTKSVNLGHLMMVFSKFINLKECFPQIASRDFFALDYGSPWELRGWSFLALES